MDMDVIIKLKEIQLVPVVKIEDEKQSMPLADALAAGGLPCAEITLRTPAGIKAIKTLADRKDFFVGAGTVLTVEEADAVCQAGAQFVVSPGFSLKLVSWCLKNSIPVFPGVATATEITTALETGLNVLKFFPAENLGGIKTIKALAAAYQSVSFMPTGGINLQNVKDYLSHPQVIACGGSWMVNPEAIHQGNFKLIEKTTREAVQLISTLK